MPCRQRPPEHVGRYRLLNWVARWIGPWAVRDRVMPILFGRTFLSDERRAAERATWAALIAANRRAVWRAVNGVVERKGVHEELGSIRAPTLVLVGEEDVATAPAKAERIASAIPGARLVRIPRAGHSSPVEEPAAVSMALVEFLTSLDRAAGGG